MGFGMSVMGLLMKILNDRILRKGDTAIKRLSHDEMTHRHHDVIMTSSSEHHVSLWQGQCLSVFSLSVKRYDDVIN